MPDSGVTVSIDWSVSGDGAQYLAFAPEGGRDHKNNMHSYGVTVMRQPDEPTEVRFVATVKDYYGNEIGKLGENGEYAAIIGALLVNAFEHSFGYYLLFPSAIVMVLLAGIVTLTTKSAE